MRHRDILDDYMPDGEWRPSDWRARVALALGTGIVFGFIFGAILFGGMLAK